MAMRTRSFVCNTLITLAMLASASVALARDNCFTREDNKSLTFDVIQQSPPPAFGVKEYVQDSPYFPATIYSTTDSEKIAQTTHASPSGLSFKKDYFLWANRCVYMKGLTPTLEDCHNTKKNKGNYYRNIVTDQVAGLQLRPMFSTYARANACTLIQAGNVLGEPRTELDAAAKNAGITVFQRTPNDAVALAAYIKKATLENGDARDYYVDVCLLDTVPMASDAHGIILDYEVWDERKPEEALALFTALASKVKKFGKELIVYTNDISTAGVHNGITSSNLQAILATVDGFAPIVWSGATQGNPETELKARERQQSFAENFKKQLDIMTASSANPLTPDAKKKVILALSLFDLQPTDAKELRAILLKEKYRGVMLWRNFARQGGSCDLPVNQAIGCITLGRCGE